MIQLHSYIKTTLSALLYLSSVLVMAISLSALTSTSLKAQEISVSSFRALDNDLTANTYGTMEKDQNGEIAALIKIPTTAQGFTFDGGMSGIVKTLQRTGEIWVYVPHGIKRISIFHQQLGYLRDYYFPVAIEKARTYEMKLVTGQVQTVTNVSHQQQMVLFQVSPANAAVELNEEALLVDEQGMAYKRLPYGRYPYRVSCTNYHTEVGVVEINADGRADVKVSLRPNFGWIDIVSDKEYHGAYIYLNNERIGQVPMKTAELKSGAYQLRVMKQMYKNHEQQVIVKDNEITELRLQMQPNFAQVTLQADAQTQVWIDGKLLGQGAQQLRLEPGQYKVETKRTSHQDNSYLLQINSLTDQTVALPEPAPMYGSLDVNTSPMMAKVYLDGQLVGETPFFANNILIGQHELRVQKEGHAPQTTTIDIQHNQVATYSLSLASQYTLRFDANGGSGTMPDQVFQVGVSQTLPANTFKRGGYVLVGWNTKADGSGVAYSPQQSLQSAQDLTLYAQWEKGNFENGHEWVDLGLSVKWATCNIGATTPEDYGDYFAWGETEPRSDYSWETYKYCKGSYDTQTKYCTDSSYGYNGCFTDNKTTLELSDDAARVNWGGKWRMPTKAEQDELRNNCRWTWTTQNGIKGYKVKSKSNGNSIFLPAAGYRYGASVDNVGSYGYYWSSSLDESYPYYAYGLYFHSGNVGWGRNPRYCGQTVRAVCP